MNRNVESHFALTPRANIKRSRFDRSHSVKTSFNVGEVVPFMWDEVLPGDTFSIDTSKVIRLQTPITPFYDNVYADFYWFFVPARLTWSNWKYFMGEQKDSPWLDDTVYTPPVVSAPTGGWNVGTLADYMEVPVGVDGLDVQALPFRAYAKIIDDWFRDENLQTPVSISLDDVDIVGNNGTNYITDLVKGGKPFIAAKYHDYFTSALPEPQRGPAVNIESVAGDLPVITAAANNDYSLFETYGTTNQAELHWFNKSGVSTSRGGSTNLGINSSGQTDYHNQSSGTWDGDSLVPSNLVAKSSSSSITVNELRMAFQMQKFYESLAIGGARYIEQIKTFFGVDSPDARLQRSEYLGGNRVPLNINQVVQQSGTEAQSGLTSTPQGTVAAYSVTNNNHSDFTKSFTEHGFILGLVCVRYDHSYQQGLAKKWLRKERFDYYNPVFAHIGNQPIYNHEIFAQGSSVVNPVSGVPYDEEVFGYQEAWADYRYSPNVITGEMRSAATNSLDIWHLGDDYSSLPSLGSSWIQEDKTNVDRVLTVSSANANQIFADIYIKNYCTRPMPLYSIPGLIDHF